MNKKQLLIQSIDANWEKLNVPPNEKTSYLFEHLYKHLKNEKELHHTILEHFRMLNEKANYEKEEDKIDMINRINKAIQELNQENKDN